MKHSFNLHAYPAIPRTITTLLSRDVFGYGVHHQQQLVWSGVIGYYLFTSTRGAGYILIIQIQLPDVQFIVVDDYFAPPHNTYLPS